MDVRREAPCSKAIFDAGRYPIALDLSDDSKLAYRCRLLGAAERLTVDPS